MMNLDGGKYSAYGFCPGMTKQEFLENTKKYPIEKESYGEYEFDFPGNGTTVQVFVDFSNGDTATQVTLQAFVAW
jgi:hypothetical protein